MRPYRSAASKHEIKLINDLHEGSKVERAAMSIPQGDIPPTTPNSLDVIRLQRFPDDDYPIMGEIFRHLTENQHRFGRVRSTTSMHVMMLNLRACILQVDDDVVLVVDEPLKGKLGPFVEEIDEQKPACAAAVRDGNTGRPKRIASGTL